MTYDELLAMKCDEIMERYGSLDAWLDEVAEAAERMDAPTGEVSDPEASKQELNHDQPPEPRRAAR